MDRCPSKVSLPATAALSASSAAPLRAASDLESDRKSTRLNSSHITISYAVFCLKKKKESYEDAFASVLGQRLKEGARRPVEVINAGVSGRGTEDELTYMKRKGIKEHPDLIVLAM